MRRTSRAARAVVVACLGMIWPAADVRAGSEPPPRAALRVRAVRPDEQLRRVLALFDGTGAPSPAAALAGWRRATGRAEALGKGPQALITLFNPEMIRELRSLRGAEFALGFDPAGGGPGRPGPWWNATVPGDDGTIGALATALTLTDGAPEPPLEGAEVDRLGPPGAPLMARDPAGGVAMASDRAAMAAAVDRLRAGEPAVAASPDPEAGWVAWLDVAALAAGADQPGDLARRRVAAGLLALGCREVEAEATLRGEAVELVLTGHYADGPPRAGAIDPAWLDWIPAGRTVAAVSVAADAAGASWASAFAAADGVERADPTRAGAAPLRARLGLAALAVGVRPESDLWPLLRGATACATTDEAGEPDGVLLALHAADADAAARIARRVVRPLVETVRDRDAAPAAGDGDEATGSPGRAFGRPLDLAVRGPTVLVAWGDGLLAASQAAQADPGRSAGRSIRESWPEGSAPQRAGAFWPGRLRPGSPATAGVLVASALEGAGPVVWWGVADGATTRDHVRWDGLRGCVRRFLARLPMEPPTGRGGDVAGDSPAARAGSRAPDRVGPLSDRGPGVPDYPSRAH